jgi:DNA-binding response OmpR family regulator
MLKDCSAKLGHTQYTAVVIDQKKIEAACEIARLVRERLKAEDTRVIVAVGGEDEEHRAIASGADSCVDKSLNGDEILSSIVGQPKGYYTH